jgi:signal transduction histidine kinase
MIIRRAATIGRTLIALLAIALFLGALVSSVSWIDRTIPGFFVGPHGVIHPVGGFDWPEKGETLFNARVVAMDGQQVHSGREIYAEVAEWPAGSVFDYTLRRGTVAQEVAVRSRVFSTQDFLETWGALLVFGFFSYLVGIVVLFLRPGSRQAQVYFLQAITAGTYALAAIFLHQASQTATGDLAILASCLFPATFIHLALVFPVEREATWVRRGVLPLAYLVAAILGGLALREFLDPLRELRALTWSYAFMALSIVALVASLVETGVRSADPLARGRVRILLPGVVLGTSASLYVFVANFFGAGLPVQFALIAPILFFASIGFAITRHDLFEIDRFVRHGFAYAALSVLVIIAYALVVGLAPRLLPGMSGLTREIAGIVAAILAALGFEPLRRRMQTSIDHTFYREELDYRSTVGEVAEALSTILDEGEVVERVTGALTQSMQLENVVLATLPAAGESGVVLERRPGAALVRRPLDGGAQSLIDAAARHGSVCPMEVVLAGEDGAMRDDLQAAGEALQAHMLIPLVFRDITEGLLVVGQRRSRTPLSDADLELLQTLARQTAIALHNARSYRALATLNRELDDKVRERTAELKEAYTELQNKEAELVQSEKMASLGQLVAGVAHELNNPASFVVGSIDNLEELFGELREAFGAQKALVDDDPHLQKKWADLPQAKGAESAFAETPALLRICSEGAERIQSIVDQLKVFVRKDRGEERVEDLAGDLRATVGLLSSRIASSRIALTQELETLAPFRGDPARLNQVWMNLLSNAIDAVQGAKERSIRLRAGTADEPGFAQIVVEDSGVGIPDAIRGKIFDPFFTTKAPGAGIGLGLSIAFEAVRGHGGRIEVADRAGGGTTFRVLLPLQPPA